LARYLQPRQCKDEYRKSRDPFHDGTQRSIPR
jgi:hypothetical protein